MRSAPFFAILAIGITALAKDPTPAPYMSSSPSRLRQSFSAPDMAQEFNMQKLNSFRSSSKSEFRAREAQSNSFYIHQKYTAKNYEAKSFRTKSAWDSDFKFATKDARTKAYETKAAQVKTAQVKEAHDSNKSAATREFSDANRTSGFKGRNQALFDKEGPAAQAKVGAGWRSSNGDGRFSIMGAPEGASWGGNLKQLTVDDVREILNKSK